MRRLRSILKSALVVALLATPLAFVQPAHAQVSVAIGLGPVYGYPAPVDVYGPPVCEWGYYSYYPYTCAPYGYYGSDWFYDGIFIGAGPWYRGWYGHPWGWGYDIGYRGWYGHNYWYGGGWRGNRYYGRGYYGARGHYYGGARGAYYGGRANYGGRVAAGTRFRGSYAGARGGRSYAGARSYGGARSGGGFHASSHSFGGGGHVGGGFHGGGGGFHGGGGHGGGHR